ncbi:MAG: ATP synthase F1 subunit gamma [Candidatus Pacebacteria bacterium]|nr:ATP synthase F1 subunit gamma [Candidatus Paceibacterota bacterium]
MELKEIRRKIESIGNIEDLTGALETLSALKMKKAQKVALESRCFAQTIAKILKKLKPVLEKKESIYLKEKRVKNSLVVILTSDRGFCGSFNQNILRFAEKEIEKLEAVPAHRSALERKIHLFPVGKKGAAFLKKKGWDIKTCSPGLGEAVSLAEVKSISDFLIKSFQEDAFQRIYLIWADFISALFQKPKLIRLLPLNRESLDELLRLAPQDEEKEEEFVIEPSPEIILQEVIPQLVEYLIYQCILENNASEHSARMMAMKNASENAEKKLEILRLQYNKARQEGITREVSEISSAKEILE